MEYNLFDVIFLKFIYMRDIPFYFNVRPHTLKAFKTFRAVEFAKKLKVKMWYEGGFPNKWYAIIKNGFQEVKKQIYYFKL